MNIGYRILSNARAMHGRSRPPGWLSAPTFDRHSLRWACESSPDCCGQRRENDLHWQRLVNGAADKVLAVRLEAAGTVLLSYYYRTAVLLVKALPGHGLGGDGGIGCRLSARQMTGSCHGPQRHAVNVV